MHIYGAQVSGTREDKSQKIEQLAEDLEEILAKLDEATLDTSYRPSGWTVRQVVHHLPTATSIRTRASNCC